MIGDKPSTYLDLADIVKKKKTTCLWSVAGRSWRSALGKNGLFFGGIFAFVGIVLDARNGSGLTKGAAFEAVVLSVCFFY